MNEGWLDRRLKRLDFLATLFESKGFNNIALELRSLRKINEVHAFYEVLKLWFF